MKRLIYASLIVLFLFLVFNSVASGSNGSYVPDCTDTPAVTVPPVETDTPAPLPSDTPVPSETPKPTETVRPTETETIVGTATPTPSVPRSEPTPTDVQENNKKPKPTQTPNMVMPDTGPFDNWNLSMLAWMFPILVCVIIFARLMRNRA